MNLRILKYGIVILGIIFLGYEYLPALTHGDQIQLIHFLGDSSDHEEKEEHQETEIDEFIQEEMDLSFLNDSRKNLSHENSYYSIDLYMDMDTPPPECNSAI